MIFVFMEKKMKVFVSWSGPVSQQIAALISDWLKHTLLTIDPIYTPNTLRAGTQGTTQLYRLLKGVYTGIFIYTRESLDSQWMIFEAGAIHGNAGNSLLLSLLFELSQKDLPEPMQGYQWKNFNKKEMLDVLHSLSTQRGDDLSRQDLERTFERAWDDLERDVNAVLAKASTTTPLPPTDSISAQLQQLLVLTESIAAKQQTSCSNLPSEPNSNWIVPPLTIVELVLQFGRLVSKVIQSGEYDLLGTLDDLGKPLYFITRKMFREDSEVVNNMRDHRLQLRQWLSGLSDD